MRDWCAHCFLSVHLAPLLSAGVTVFSLRYATPRVLILATSIAWRHVTGDPVRAVLLAWRVLPRPVRGVVRLAGPYGAAAALWGAGDRAAALGALDCNPRRQAAFALAVDRPQVARAALARLPRADPYLAAQLAWREGRLDDAVAAAAGATRPAWRARRLRAALAAQLQLGDTGDTPPRSAVPPGGMGDRPPTRPGGAGGRPPVNMHSVLHIVTDALPSTSAGYTIRTHEIVRAQRAAGLDPHVLTASGFPVTQGVLDGRRLVTLDGVAYHRLLPWTAGADPARPTTRLATRLAGQLRPDIVHAASNYKNATTALALRDAYGTPVVYEVRGFWEDTWLSRHPADEQALRASELYRRIRAEETACMRAADLVVTLGEAMRDEIVSRGIPADKVTVVPNAVSDEFLQPLVPAEHDGFTVGTVTTLNPHEGLGALLDAVRLLTERGVPARALIVGDGPGRQPLQRHAESEGIPATFTGRVPAARVREYHALLDVFVVPRTRDRVCQLVTPLKPVEAMASGLCVVTSEVSALSEIVKHEVTGALTVPQDPVSLADCLEWLFYSPDIRKKLGTAAREWVAADRTWKANAVRYVRAYERLRG
jgi:glycosyltransferase involved in cell wall biosynthesis